MAVAHRASTTQSTTTTTLTLDKPAGTADADVLIAAIVTRSSAAVTAAPSGWMALISRSIDASKNLYVYWKTASGEGSSWSWTLQNDAAAAQIGIASAYSGGAGITTQSNDVQNPGVATLDIVAQAITTLVADSMLVGFFWAIDDPSISPPVLFTERAEIAGRLETCDAAQATAGNSGNKTAMQNSLNTNVRAAVLIGIEPPQNVTDRWGVVPIPSPG